MLRGLVVSVMVSVGGLEAAAGADCGKIPTRAGPVDYCVSITNSSKNPDILTTFMAHFRSRQPALRRPLLAATLG